MPRGRELSGSLAGHRGRAVGLALALLAICALWAWAASALWQSSVPALKLAHVDAASQFSASYLARSSSYGRFLDIDRLLGEIVLLGVLVLYARRGHRLMRESAAGAIGTGMMLGMLGFAVVWIAEIPFGLAAVWWERRHGVSHEGYVTSVISSFLALGGRFVFVGLALALAMGLATLTRRWWWALAAPLFASLALLSSFLSIYLIPETTPLRDAATAADIRRLARVEGVPGTRAEVQRVAKYTTAPNAESVGFGPTRRLILWDTLLDGRFDRREIAVVSAHELGHIAHRHILRRVGWLALALLPISALIALLTRGRGGLSRPEAIPVALLVYVALQLVTMPLTNLVSRHEEAEADWSALKATRDPAAAVALFRNLARTSLAAPDPEGWAYVLYADHPTIAQRIAMVHAWERQAGARRRRRRRGRRRRARLRLAARRPRKMRLAPPTETCEPSRRVPRRDPPVSAQRVALQPHRRRSAADRVPVGARTRRRLRRTQVEPAHREHHDPRRAAARGPAADDGPRLAGRTARQRGRHRAAARVGQGDRREGRGGASGGRARRRDGRGRRVAATPAGGQPESQSQPEDRSGRAATTAASAMSDPLALGVQIAALLGPEPSRLLEAWRAVVSAAPDLSPSDALARAEAELRSS